MLIRLIELSATIYPIIYITVDLIDYIKVSLITLLENGLIVRTYVHRKQWYIKHTKDGVNMGMVQIINAPKYNSLSYLHYL